MINDPCLGEDALIKILIKSQTVLLCSALPHHEGCSTISDLFLSSVCEKRAVMSQVKSTY